MKWRGYDWNEYTRTFKATVRAISYAQARVQEAIKQGQPKETIAELQAEVNKLEAELKKDPLKEALKSLASSYSNVTDDVISELNAQFTAKEIAIDVNKYVKEQADGTKKLDVEKFIQAIPEKYRELFDDVIASTADSYTSNIQKAVSLVSSGTSSVSEMETFTKSYNEMFGEAFGEKTISDLFKYDEIQ